MIEVSANTQADRKENPGSHRSLQPAPLLARNKDSQSQSMEPLGAGGVSLTPLQSIHPSPESLFQMGLDTSQILITQVQFPKQRWGEKHAMYFGEKGDKPKKDNLLETKC